MNIIKKISFEEFQKIRAACLENATDLNSSAKKLFESGELHIAYHLTLLALEELGKLFLIQMQYSFNKAEDELQFIPDLEDHTKKIFWAIWEVFFCSGKDPKLDFEFQQGLSKNLHENRLEYLYVNPNNPVSPRSKVPQKDVEMLINLTAARLEYEFASPVKEFTPELDELARWFILAAEDPEKRSFIFSQESFQQMRQVKNSRAWIQWIKDRYEKARKEMEELLRIEKERQIPAETDGTPKWRVNVQFVSESNTIRPSFISFWNKNSTNIIVAKGKTKKHLNCQFILLDTVSVDDIFANGWTFAKVFVVAINIATLGYFWWYVPSENYEYFESIVDIDNPKIRLKAKEADYGIEWEQRPIKEDDAFNTKLIMAYMVRIYGKPEEAALDAYFHGLNLIGKSDAHLQFQLNGYEAFFRALLIGMKISGKWDGKEDFEQAALSFLGVGVSDVEDFKRLMRLGINLNEMMKTGSIEIKMQDIADLKSYCDAFFMFRAAELVRDSVIQELNQKGDSDSIVDN